MKEIESLYFWLGIDAEGGQNEWLLRVRNTLAARRRTGPETLEQQATCRTPLAASIVSVVT